MRYSKKVLLIALCVRRLYVKTRGCDIDIYGVSLLAEFMLLVVVTATLTVSLQRTSYTNTNITFKGVSSD